MNSFLLLLFTSVIRIILHFFPHKSPNSKQILFTSYCGKQYSCNPKYISKYIQEHYPDYHLIWAFQDPSQFSNLENEGIQIVKYYSLHFIKACLESGYIVTNARDLLYIPFSKKQTVINTWHGGGAYKKVGSSVNKVSSAEQYRLKLMSKINYVYLSSSKAFTQMTIKESFHHDGKILETGMPRNDLLVNCNTVSYQVHDYYHIPHDTHILLYAPTYREDKKVSDYAFDFDKILPVLQKRFGGNWVILFRTHYFIAQTLSKASAQFVDASKYADMQELLLEASILITDYSSSMWDFSLMYKPCFLYATDLNQYDQDEGFYTNIHSWPFPLAQTFDELLSRIEAFDTEAYNIDVRNHHLELGSFENGHACKTVCEAIITHSI